MRRALICPLIAAGTAVLLAACSGSGQPDRVSPRPVSRETSSTVAAVALTTVPEPTMAPLVQNGPRTVTPGAPVISIRVNPGISPGFTRVRNDVSDVVCAPGPSGWTVSGKVTNPVKVPVAYHIYVAFVTAHGATRGLLQIDVKRVEVDSTVAWTGDLALDESQLACVVRAERGKADE